MKGNFICYTSKSNWNLGREKFLEEGLSVREIRYILIVRICMLPLNFKPWFPDNIFTCSLCNLQQNETVQHFLIDCPILNEFRIYWSSNDNVMEVLNGKFGWKNLASFVSLALNYRTQLTEEFNFKKKNLVLAVSSKYRIIFC